MNDSPALVVTQPKAGYSRLRFVTDESDPMAKLIRFDTMTKVASHVEAVTPQGIIGAYGDGVCLKPPDYDAGSTAQTFVDIPMDAKMLSSWLANLNVFLGTPYDYEAIAGLAAHIDMHEPGHVICSALQTLVLRRCRFFEYPLTASAHLTTPRDLLLVLSGLQAHGVIIHPTEYRGSVADHSMMRLGRIAAAKRANCMALAPHLEGLPRPPEFVLWFQKLENIGVMMNDSLGDCTCAGVGHAIQTWTSLTGQQITPTDADILALYEGACGYKPSDPSTDQGGVEPDVLNYWKANGVAGHKLDGYASVNTQNTTEVRQAVQLFGVVYIGVALPLSAQSQSVWDVTDASLAGDAAPGSWGGHCVIVVGYNSRGPLVVTWGKVLQMTWDFWASYADEAYALLSKDWIETSGSAPSGFDYAALAGDLAEV